MLTFGSLFSGIGGMDLGLERAEMKCLWQVEIDDWCNRVLAKHWPEVRRYKDVKEVGKHNLEPVDLICGGFPCQPHSVAGKRKGAADDRNLWPEYLRIITELQPRYILGENVPGIITTYLDTVLSDLEGAGYITATFNIPACAFDAPHRRERIFIIAHRKRLGRKTRASQRIQSEIKKPEGQEPEHVCESASKSRDVANRNNERQLVREYKQGYGNKFTKKKLESSQPIICSNNIARRWWTVEPDVGRVAHGISNRVDRLRGLGNAVVPQVAEWIGKRIIEFDRSET